MIQPDVNSNEVSDGKYVITTKKHSDVRYRYVFDTADNCRRQRGVIRSAQSHGKVYHKPAKKKANLHRSSYYQHL